MEQLLWEEAELEVEGERQLKPDRWVGFLHLKSCVHDRFYKVTTERNPVKVLVRMVKKDLSPFAITFLFLQCHPPVGRGTNWSKETEAGQQYLLAPLVKTAS